jgi:hypothetical protein
MDSRKENVLVCVEGEQANPNFQELTQFRAWNCWMERRSL